MRKKAEGSPINSYSQTAGGRGLWHLPPRLAQDSASWGADLRSAQSDELQTERTQGHESRARMCYLYSAIWSVTEWERMCAHSHTDRHKESLLQFQPAQANNSQKDTSCSQIKNSSWEVDGLGGTSQSTPKIGRVWERSGQCCEEATKSCLRLHSPSPGIILIVLSCTVHSLPLLNSSTHYTV